MVDVADNLRNMGHSINYKQALSNQKTRMFSWRALSIVAYLRFTRFPLENFRACEGWVIS